MAIPLTTAQKILKIELALKIIKHSAESKIPLSKSAEKFGKDKRFLYDVNRRWVVKNPKGIPQDMIEEMKSLFNPKTLYYKKDKEETE